MLRNLGNWEEFCKFSRTIAQAACLATVASFAAACRAAGYGSVFEAEWPMDHLEKYGVRGDDYGSLIYRAIKESKPGLAKRYKRDNINPHLYRSIRKYLVEGTDSVIFDDEIDGWNKITKSSPLMSRTIEV